MIDVEYSTHYAKDFKKLDPQKKKQAIQAEKIFKKNPHHSKLKTHKLTGKLNGLWAFSINYQDRIIFAFVTENKVVLYRVGSHDVYYKK